MHMKLIRFAGALLLLAFFAGCASTIGPTPNQIVKARAAMLEEIKAEPRGAYFVGRRYFKTEYKFWGFVRPAGQPWSAAKMVMMNENQKLAPDRAAGKLGSDNNYEYKLLGYYSGDKVYEPASNGIYPEFVLKGYELRSASPAPIYREAGATDPNVRIVARPY
jgi:hypothetical protein